MILMSLNFSWDDKKNTINKKKHKISFEEAETAFYDERAKIIASMISSSLWLLTNENLTPKESTLLNNAIVFAYDMVKVSSQSVFEIENSSDFESRRREFKGRIIHFFFTFIRIII